jgi:hypothetical protein
MQIANLRFSLCVLAITFSASAHSAHAQPASPSAPVIPPPPSTPRDIAVATARSAAHNHELDVAASAYLQAIVLDEDPTLL